MDLEIDIGLALKHSIPREFKKSLSTLPIFLSKHVDDEMVEETIKMTFAYDPFSKVDNSSHLDRIHNLISILSEFRRKK